MLIVISHPAFFTGEADLINSLFDDGMEIFHLRKPGCTGEEMTRLLGKIDPVHYPKIALHQTHSPASSSGIHRLHFPEAGRKATLRSQFNQLRREGFILSTSVHHIDDLKTLPDDFSYAFFGPVFTSISKPGYEPSPGRKILSPERNGPRAIAIGGIHSGNCTEPFMWGYDGIAVLGALWQHGDAISNYRKIKAACATTAR